MATGKIDFGVLDDDVRWAQDADCVELLVAGIWFLHQTMLSCYPKCTLLSRIKRLGDLFEATWRRTGGDSSQVTAPEVAVILPEMHTLATLGRSLWHLRSYHHSPGLRYELKELSKVGCGENEHGDALCIRGRGFGLLAAASIAKQGFALDFVRRSKDGQQTPDFFATRDGNRFCCEVTSRQPQKGDFSSVEFFWSSMNEIVTKKKPQFQTAEPRYGVLIVDCTPILHALDLSNIPIGGQPVYFIPPHLGGPRSGSAPCVRYDDTAMSVGLKNLEWSINNSAIRTLILWKNRCEIEGQNIRREMAYRVLGAIDGVVFWSHFEKALAFPGPCTNVNWT